MPGYWVGPRRESKYVSVGNLGGEHLSGHCMVGKEVVALLVAHCPIVYFVTSSAQLSTIFVRGETNTLTSPLNGLKRNVS